MRALRVAAPVQLALLTEPGYPTPAERWSRLPEPTRADVLVLLARLIARGVLVDDAADASVTAAPGGERRHG